VAPALRAVGEDGHDATDKCNACGSCRLANE
jgi:hypothetical protein